MKYSLISSLVILAASASTSLWAQTVDIKDGWVRATVQGQKATGGFMTITSKNGGKLVGVSSPVAGVSEVHEMKMEGDVMKMREVEGGLDLPAGKAVTLKPGGYHVMLMDLKQPLKPDTTVPVTLVFKDAKGTETKTELQFPVKLAAPGQASGAMQHDAHKH